MTARDGGVPAAPVLAVDVVTGADGGVTGGAGSAAGGLAGAGADAAPASTAGVPPGASVEGAAGWVPC